MIDYLSFTDLFDDLILAIIKSCKGEKRNNITVVCTTLGGKTIGGYAWLA
jgi:hypothetical protein